MGHALTAWFEALQDSTAHAGLTSAMSGGLPERVASLVDFPLEDTTVSNALVAALASDPVNLRKLQTGANKCTITNTQNAIKRSAAIREDDNKIFSLISSSMRLTAPNLCKTLIIKCDVPGYPGFYSGRLAVRLISEHCAVVSAKGISAEYYERLNDALRLRSNHLKNQCSAASFSALARVFTTTINAHLDRPYQGVGLGKAIIDLLPYEYLEAKERLSDELLDKGILHDSAQVISACLLVVSRRSAANAPLGNITDASILVALTSGEGEDDSSTPSGSLSLTASIGKKGGKKNPRRPPGWVADCVTAFCPACPHTNKDGKKFLCYSDPRATITVAIAAKVLLNPEWHAKVVANRAKNAKKMGVTPVPFPPLSASAQPSTDTTVVTTLSLGGDDDLAGIDEWIEGFTDGYAVCMVSLEDHICAECEVVAPRDTSPGLASRADSDQSSYRGGLTDSDDEDLPESARPDPYSEDESPEVALMMSAPLPPDSGVVRTVDGSLGVGAYVVYNEDHPGRAGPHSGVFRDTSENMDRLCKSSTSLRVERHIDLKSAHDAYVAYLAGGGPLSATPWYRERPHGPTVLGKGAAATPSPPMPVGGRFFGEAGTLFQAAVDAPTLYSAVTPARLDFGSPTGTTPQPPPDVHRRVPSPVSIPQIPPPSAPMTLIPEVRASGLEPLTPNLTPNGTTVVPAATTVPTLQAGMVARHRTARDLRLIAVASLLPFVFCAVAFALEYVGLNLSLDSVLSSFSFVGQGLRQLACYAGRAGKAAAGAASAFGRFVTPALRLLGGWQGGLAALLSWLILMYLVTGVGTSLAPFTASSGVTLGDASFVAARRGSAGSQLRLIGDSGAGRWMGNSTADFEEGSLYAHTTQVQNAAGSNLVCTQRGTMSVTIPTTHGLLTLRSPHSILNESCPYKLASLGQLSSTHGAALHMPAWGGDGYLMFPSGARAVVVNSGVFVIPTAEAGPTGPVDALVQGVTRGKHTAMTVKGSMTGSILHARFKHCAYANITHIDKALSDVPDWWVATLRESPCDICLRGHMDSLPGTGSIPKDQGFIAYDVWQTRVPFVHGGHRYQALFLHTASNVSKSYRMKNRAEALVAIQQAYVWFSTRSQHPITWMHTDLAPELSRDARVTAFLRNHRVRSTTNAPGISRSNPAERRHRTIRSATAKALIQSKLPITYHGYAWEDSENGLACVPTLAPPHTTPYEALTGKKPKPYERPFGCLAYVKVPNVNKVGEDARRGLCMGYGLEQVGKPSQAAYSIYVPSMKRMVVTPMVSFVEDCFPGLSIAADGEEQMGAPTFAPDYVAPTAPSGPLADTIVEVDDLPSGASTAPLTWESYDFEAEGAETPWLGIDFPVEAKAQTSPNTIPTEQVEPDVPPILQPHEMAKGQLRGELEGQYWQPASGLGTRRATTSKYARPSAASARSTFALSFAKMGRSLGFDADSSFLSYINERPDYEVVALAMMSACYEAERGSPDEMEARREYAGECARAAIAGVELPAYEPLFSYGLSGARRGTLARAFEEEGGSHVVIALGSSDLDLELALAASTRGIVTHRRMLTLPDKAQWHDSMVLELDTLTRMGCFEKVSPRDPRVQGRQVVETMFTGVYKPAANGKEEVRKARCVIRGDLMRRMRTANQNNSPTIFDSSFKCAEAVKVLRGMHEIYFDYKAAYVQGKNAVEDIIVARAPMGHREFDENGDELLWLMSSALYGQTDAGAVWNRTLNEFTTGGEVGMLRNTADPCLYSKTLAGGGLIVMPIYVDDGKMSYDPTPECEAEIERVKKAYHARFKLSYGETDPTETYFLAKDIVRHDSTRTTIRSTTYIRRLGEAHLEGSLGDYPAAWSHTPASKELVRALDTALARKEAPAAGLAEKYGSLVMAMMYKSSDRPDITTAVCMLSRAMHYPTLDLMKCAVRVLVYLMRSDKLGITYSSSGEGARKLTAQVDSNWSTKQSSSGFVATLAGATVSHYHRRQHCIAMSSCEAELMALSTAALELLFLQGVLEGLGYVFEGEYGPELETTNKEVHSIVYRHGPPEVDTDSKAAYDSCHRDSAGQYSRHIERRVYKMRELCGGKRVKLVLIGTADNSSDLFTKVLERQLFEKHRGRAMNLSAA